MPDSAHFADVAGTCADNGLGIDIGDLDFAPVDPSLHSLLDLIL